MIRLKWSDNSNNELGFVLQRETQLTSTSWGSPATFNISANQSSYDDDAPVGFYRYKIQSYNLAGSSSFTSWTNVQYTPTPADPTNFNVTNVGDGVSVNLTWKDNSTNETVFHIIWDKQVSGSWVRQSTITVPANSTSYLHSPGAGTYRYCIRSAYSVLGVAYKSNLTPWISVTVAVVYLPPAAPTNFTVTLEMDQKTVSFTWVDNSTNETAFHLIPQYLSGSTWVTLNYIRITQNKTSYSYKPGAGDWKFAIRSAYSINGYAYKSALTPWVQIHVPL